MFTFKLFWIILLTRSFYVFLHRLLHESQNRSLLSQNPIRHHHFKHKPLTGKRLSVQNAKPPSTARPVGDPGGLYRDQEALL